VINVLATQQWLANHAHYITPDGVLGPETYANILSVVSQHPVPLMPFAVPLGAAMVKYLNLAGINTPLRLAHFLAQTACETAGFMRMKEWDGGNPHYFDRYEPPSSVAKMLGNQQAGDGAKYCGRGLLDSTGRWNYQNLHNLTGIDCVNHPELLEQPDSAVVAAISFWTHHDCNTLADADNITAITKIINGGLTGLNDREIYLSRAKTVIH
jgi:putative chitinase